MLNFLNRLIVSAVLIAVSVLLLAVAVTPQGVADLAVRQLSQVHVELVSVDHLVIAVVCLLLVVLCLVVLRFQWSRGRPTSVPLDGAGSTELATESVVERLKQDVSAVGDVRQVFPTVHVRGKIVDIAVEVRTEPGVDVPTKASEVDQVIKDSVGRLGLKLGRVRTKIVVARGTPSAGKA
jgi:hypothetical protein